MPVGNDGGEKRRENLVSSFLKSRIEGGNDGGETITYVSWILCFLNVEELKEIVGGWRARVRARNEMEEGRHENIRSSFLRILNRGLRERCRSGDETYV